jgi:D-alanyl-D-alanine dipeptidase
MITFCDGSGRVRNRTSRRTLEVNYALSMDAAGFINYLQEWWHWSYGDRYWAFQTSAEATLYGPR